MKPFDAEAHPLEGSSLVEASAGTGKTHNLTLLLARLVMERDLEIDQILVVTFTEASAAELTERTRERLAQMREALETGGALDGASADLLPEDAARRAAYLDRVRRALRSFDKASISTIHGFAGRVLEENAFESGEPFVAKISAQADDLLKEVVEDTWVTWLHDADPLWVRLLAQRKMGPKQLMGIVAKGALDRGVIHLPEKSVSRVSQKMLVRLRERYGNAARIWHDNREEIVSLITDGDALNRNSYKGHMLDGLFSKVDVFLTIGGSASLPQVGVTNGKTKDGIIAFTSSRLEEKTKKGKQTPRHLFFDAAQALAEMNAELDAEVTAFKTRFLDEVRSRLKVKKAQAGVRSFDDLITGLDDALSGESGKALARRLAKRYKAILIDEFQDTDSVQYRIFDGLVNLSGAPCFMVGDPKQAIYGFRGGDIYAYLEAAKGVGESRYSLGVNWRSDPAVVRGVNTVFSNVRRPFGLDGIDFDPVDSAPPSFDRLKWEMGESGLSFVWMDSDDEEGSKPSAESIKHRVLSRMIGDVKGLLSTGFIDEKEERRRVEPEDIGVLVRSNDEGAMVQEAFKEVGIGAVRKAAQSIFDSVEALELATILHAVARPFDQGRVRAALLTQVFGISPESLADLLSNSAAQTLWVERFSRWQGTWKERGVFACVNEILQDDSDGGSPLERLLAGRSGDRRMTNLGHLAELMNEFERREGCEPFALLRWLERMIWKGGDSSEKEAVRTQGDGKLVISTIHKSKGLQYPIVLLPFMWRMGSSLRDKEHFVFHDPRRNWARCMDLGTEEAEENLRRARNEAWDESFRLTYVALTRAKHYCRVYWGKLKGMEKTPLGALLHGGGTRGAEGDLAKRLKKVEEGQLLKELRELAQKSEHGILVENESACGEYELERREPAVQLESRVLAAVPPAKTTTSFSRMISEAQVQKEEERILGESGGSFVDEDSSLFTVLEPSARTGSCLHEILEGLDFSTCDPSSIEEVASPRLREFGFDETKALKAVVQDLDRVIRKGLVTPYGEFALEAIAPDKKLVEMEFTLPLCKKAVGRTLPRKLPGKLRAGDRYLTGFVDLIFEQQGRFYVTDYKTNHLGSSPGDYQRSSMEAAMKDHGYVLQYNLYLLALVRHLRRTMPGFDYERHIGGVFYLFVRGMGGSGQEGVYYERPSLDDLLTLEDGLLARGEP